METSVASGKNPPESPTPHVLLVDDDPVVRHLLRRSLIKTFRCTVDEAADGAEALRMISKTAYQLVLLDLRMPGMDGMQVLGMIRSTPATATLPVVVLSTTRADDVVHSALQMGIADFFVKPLTKEIVDRLGRFLARQAA